MTGSAWSRWKPPSPNMIDGKVGPVESSPEQECPTGAVPQATDQHGRHQAQMGGDHRAAPGQGQRHVDVVAKVSRQRHVPKVPELDDAGGLVGGGEVQGQIDPEHQGQPHRHVGIRGEIEVELEGVAKGTHPRVESGEASHSLRIGIEDRASDGPHHVGEDDLLREPDAEQGKPGGHPVRPQGTAPAKLRNHLVMVEDRPGDEVGEVGDEREVLKEVGLVGRPGIGVDQERDLSEREEGDPERKEDLEGRNRETEGRVQVQDEEVGVLVVPQDHQVAANSHEEYRKGESGPLAQGRQPAADDEIEHHRAKQQGQIPRVPERIERDRRHAEDQHLKAGSDPRSQGIGQEGEREEEEDEAERVEQHGREPGSIPAPWGRVGRGMSRQPFSAEGSAR